MRLVDYFIDVIAYSRSIEAQLGSNQVELNAVRDKLIELLIDSTSNAIKAGFAADVVDAARYPVVAFIDELIMCSDWSEKSQWQKKSLQRKFYETTNIGAEFYTRLNELSKHGSDEWVRGVYALVLGLGFKGKYFSIDDRPQLEAIKTFNISLLIPEEAQRNLDTATLFPSAYGSHARGAKGNFKTRLNVIPFVIGAPILISLGLVIYCQFNISNAIGQIIKSVN